MFVNLKKGEKINLFTADGETSLIRTRQEESA